jgi:hypothetical protein
MLFVQGIARNGIKEIVLLVATRVSLQGLVSGVCLFLLFLLKLINFGLKIKLF